MHKNTCLLLFTLFLSNTVSAQSADVSQLRNCLNTAHQIKEHEAQEAETVQCLWEASAQINEQISQSNRQIDIRKMVAFPEVLLLGMRPKIEQSCAYDPAKKKVDIEYYDLQQIDAILCMLEQYQGLLQKISNTPPPVLKGPVPTKISGEFVAEEFGASSFARAFAQYFLSPSEHQSGILLNFNTPWIIIGTGDLDGYGGSIENLRYDPSTGEIAFSAITESGSGSGEKYPLQARGIVRNGFIVLDIDVQGHKAQRTVLFQNVSVTE